MKDINHQMEIEELQKMAKIYKEMGELIEEMIQLDEQPEVSNEQIENVLGKIVVKSIEMNSLTKGIKI